MRDREIEEIEAEAEVHAERAAAEPYSPGELRTVLRRPHKVVEIVMAERGRLAASLSDRRNLGMLAAVLLLASVIFALPYGAVLAPGRLWQIVQLFAGSALICFPALHVFGAFLGFRVDIGQSLALTLIITSVSALFSLGFFPILWFLRTVMADEASAEVLHCISVGLLVVSFGCGLAHVLRCMADPATKQPFGSGFAAVVAVWQCLLVFITYRMAVFLDLV
ncbi:MAG: hypothetical protein JRF63_06920 [Deltaproteobacteria bacterium]|nr:hypothetical protein [Deltaproteobacteria bacterium]